MASDLEFVQYVVDQARKSVRLTHRKMFGEFALYANRKVVALVCDNALYMKPTEEGRRWLSENARLNEAAPFPGAKNWFLIEDELDNPERLGELLRVTERSVPMPVSKPAKRKTSAKK